MNPQLRWPARGKTGRFFCLTFFCQFFRWAETGRNWPFFLLTLAAMLAGCGAPSDNPTKPPPAATNASLEMVPIPAGSFNMGSADQDEADQKQHQVRISAFFMDKYPVTQEAYQRFMGQNPSLWKGPRHPVDQIRWRDAAVFCNARSLAEGLQPAYDTNTWACHFDATGYRLPTEAEYEYALRAGSTTDYGLGNSVEDLKRTLRPGFH